MPEALHLTRLIQAPPARVFQAFTDPEHLQKWWGPERFTNPRCLWNAEPEGELDVHMRGPDGQIFPMGGRMLEVVADRRLTFLTWPLDAEGRPLFEVRTTVVLEADGPHTRLSLAAEVSGLTAEGAPYVEGMAQGWDQSLHRLDLLVWEPLSEREVVAFRHYPASPGEVHAAWVDPERLATWWGPAGFTNTNELCEPWPGGTWRFTMHGPDGKDYPNVCRFVEVEPHRIAIQHVGAPEFILSADLIPEGEGTRLVWRQAFAEADTCRKLRSYVLQPNEDNLDRLGADLAAHR